MKIERIARGEIKTPKSIMMVNAEEKISVMTQNLKKKNPENFIDMNLKTPV